MKVRGLIFILLLTVISCEQEEQRIEITDKVKNYLVLGHIYDWSANGARIDPRLENIDYSSYEGIWLGGDLCTETTQKEETLDYLDDIFDLSNPRTSWAVGNHDVRNGNLEWIEKVTERDLYHLNHFDGITLLTLNTQTEHPTFIDSCGQKLAQVQFIHSVLDTIELSEYLILFSHNSVWEDAEPSILAFGQIANQTAFWVDFECQRKSLFRLEFYPKLTEIQEAGTQVILVAGDGGQYSKSFQHIGESGIQYFVTGINNSVLSTNDSELIESFDTMPDSVLILSHDLEMGSLSAKFVPVSEL